MTSGTRLHLPSGLWRDGLVAFFLPLTVYVATASRTVMPEDDGLFILAAYFNGVAHPPGYPLFTLLTHPFTWLPLDSVAFRVHLASAMFAAAATLAAWWSMLAIPGISRLGALTGALALAFSATFWSQAIIAEVYCLNAALFLIILGLSLRYLRSACSGSPAPRSASLPVIAFVFGLSLANHWPLTILGCTGLGVMFLTVWRQFLRDLPLALPAAVLGLLPYLWLYLRSQMNIPISFYGPLHSWEAFWFMVSREGYAAVDHRESAQFADKLGFVSYFLTDIAYQFRTPGLALGVIGCVAQWTRWPKALALGLTISFLCSSVLLALLLGFDDSKYYRAIFRVYPIVANAIWAIWIGLGVSIGIQFILARLASISWRHTAAGVASGMFVLYLGTSHAPANDRHLDSLAENYARTALATLPKEAIVFVSGDMYFGPLVYTHIVERVRPDITLYNPLGLVLGNRLFHPLGVVEERQTEITTAFIESRDRPVCVVGHWTYGFAFEENWLFQCLRPSARPGDNTYQVHHEHLRFLQRLVHEGVDRKPWMLAMRNHLLQRMGELSTYIVHGDSPESANLELVEAYEAAMKTAYGRLGALKMLLLHIDPELQSHAVLVQNLLAAMPADNDWYQLKEEAALLHYFRGLVHRSLGGPQDGRREFEAALQSWLSPRNEAAAQLLEELDSGAGDLDPELTSWLGRNRKKIDKVAEERKELQARAAEFSQYPSYRPHAQKSPGLPRPKDDD